MNPLLPIINNYFKEVVFVNSDIITLHGALREYNKLDWSNHSTDFINASTVHYRTLDKKDGGDLGLSKYSRLVTPANFDKSMARIESRASLQLICHTYELLELTMKKLLIELIEIECNRFKKLGNITKKFIQSNQGTNNNGLFSLLRKMSTHYAKLEKENSWGFDYAIWLDLIADIRHSCVHSGMNATSDFISKLSKNRKQKMFNEDFKLVEHERDLHIATTRESAGKVIAKLNSFAILVFESVSIELGEDPNYKRN